MDPDQIFVWIYNDFKNGEILVQQNEGLERAFKICLDRQIFSFLGVQWLSGKVLDSRPRGHGF